MNNSTDIIDTEESAGDVHVSDLRRALMETIKGVKSGAIKVEQAKAIAELSQVVVNSARVEVEFSKATGDKQSKFLGKKEELPAGITGVTRHRLR